jgi:NTP pyrophosphatase (non-canonical NTP hydrolase)
MINIFNKNKKYQTTFDKVAGLNNAWGVKPKGFMDEEEKDLSINLIKEELSELIEAMDNNNAVEVLDACVDLCFVVMRIPHILEMNFDGAFDEVLRSNYSKFGDDGKPVYRDDGKIMKGKNYSPPKLDIFV